MFAYNICCTTYVCIQYMLYNICLHTIYVVQHMFVYNICCTTYVGIEYMFVYKICLHTIYVCIQHKQMYIIYNIYLYDICLHTILTIKTYFFMELYHKYIAIKYNFWQKRKNKNVKNINYLESKFDSWFFKYILCL